jgi:glycosyltransferase involved in cell wall biosynthesis
MRLIDAFAEVTTRYRASVTMVGHGPLESALRDAIASRGLQSVVAIRGFVDQPDLPQLYAEHDLFVFPTLEDTFGIVLLEAMAAGLPVIASCFAGATSDYVVPDVTGWVMDPSSSNQIASTLADALKDRRTWGRLGGEARRRVEHESPAHAADGFVEAVKIAGRHAPVGSPVEAAA